MGSLGGILETSWAVLAKFLSRLGPQLGSILDPKMALELPKSRPRGAYRTPKRPLGAKNHPKAAQSPPKPPREVPRPPLSLNFRGSTVAGTRLCRAEDPPRQALCLRMAYRVRLPGSPSHLPFLLLSFLTSVSSGYTKDIHSNIQGKP